MDDNVSMTVDRRSLIGEPIVDVFPRRSIKDRRFSIRPKAKSNDRESTLGYRQLDLRTNSVDSSQIEDTIYRRTT